MQELKVKWIHLLCPIICLFCPLPWGKDYSQMSTLCVLLQQDLGVCVCVCASCRVRYMDRMFLSLCQLSNNMYSYFRALKDADVIVLLGARLNWILHFGKPPRFSRNIKIIQV